MATGDLLAHDFTIGSAERRFGKFVDAIREQRVVPLLGAGVSAQRIDTAKDLVAKLADLFKQEKRIPKPSKSDSLARVAELAIRVHGYAKTCQTLKIPSWADKAPAPAHRYLAMLAADGMIDEIISTNYDCCIEKAWKGLGRNDGPFVITNSMELNGSRPRWNGSRLYLYKINGCAANLKRAMGNGSDKEEAAAEKILLTDTQLQGFGKRDERRWVRDLLRDRTRSRTLLLSGFGSDEPQVWHVIRLILEELTLLKNGSKNAHSEGAEPTPRLWVSLHGNHLPFHILTALADEAELRGRKPLKDGENAGFDNIFSQIDATFFGLACDQKLDAGAFWRKVWLEVLKRNLEDREGPVATVFVRSMVGRHPRHRFPGDAKFFAGWKKIVKEVFDHIPLDEPPGWDEPSGSKENQQGVPGAPGIAWAEDRYLTVLEEPEFWTVLVLSTFHKIYSEGEDARPIEIESFPFEHVPTIGVTREQLRISGVSSVGPHSVLARLEEDDSKEQQKQVIMHISTELLNYLHLSPGVFARCDNDKDFLECVKTVLRSFFCRDAFNCARQEEHEKRSQWRMRDNENG